MAIFDAPIAVETGKFAPDTLIEFFTFDLTAFAPAQPIIRIVSGTDMGSPMQFNGDTYQPWACKTSGFLVKTQGAANKPKIEVANVDNSWGSLCELYDGCKGAVVYRHHTYKKYLDGKSGITAAWPVEEWLINKPVSNNYLTVTFELISWLSLIGKYIPGNLVYKNRCGFTYRKWSGTEFVYYSCPYGNPAYNMQGPNGGANYYTWDDQPTADPALDVCSQTRDSCQVRYEAGNPIPARMFLGVGDAV